MYTETRVALVCSYDSDADAAYLYLDHPIPAAGVRRTVPFDPADGEYTLDLDPEGRVVGLEILGAGTRLPPPLLRAILNQTQEQGE
ncbi:DUF2283 domain-containing protein [Micromonospora sp. NPDC005298]|uniref:DUF2283 domain-containing protein n=1 Tax=Micromonospora sp. NPDC005298 TaxID=3156873 RepID=UPI0033B592BE